MTTPINRMYRRITSSSICLFLLLASISFAQSGVGVSPPREVVAVGPGSTLTKTILVDNPTAEGGPLDVNVSVGDFVISPTGDPIFLAANSHSQSIASWISTSEQTFSLRPTEEQEINIDVSVPADAVPGTYWGLVFFESVTATPNAAAESVGVSLQTRTRVAYVLYVDVGAVERQGAVQLVQVPAPTFDAAEVSLVNTGNGTVNADGRIEVRDAAGQLVAETELDPHLVLPGYSAVITADFAEPLAPGTYTLLAAIDLGGETLIAGEGSVTIP